MPASSCFLCNVCCAAFSINLVIKGRRNLKLLKAQEQVLTDTRIELHMPPERGSDPAINFVKKRSSTYVSACFSRTSSLLCRLSLFLLLQYADVLSCLYSHLFHRSRPMYLDLFESSACELLHLFPVPQATRASVFSACPLVHAFPLEVSVICEYLLVRKISWSNFRSIIKDVPCKEVMRNPFISVQLQERRR